MRGRRRRRRRKKNRLEQLWIAHTGKVKDHHKKKGEKKNLAKMLSVAEICEMSEIFFFLFFFCKLISFPPPGCAFHTETC